MSSTKLFSDSIIDTTIDKKQHFRNPRNSPPASILKSQSFGPSSSKSGSGGRERRVASPRSGKNDAKQKDELYHQQNPTHLHITPNFYSMNGSLYL
jgi:hypothetical protein